MMRLSENGLIRLSKRVMEQVDAVGIQSPETGRHSSIEDKPKNSSGNTSESRVEYKKCVQLDQTVIR